MKEFLIVSLYILFGIITSIIYRKKGSHLLILLGVFWPWTWAAEFANYMIEKFTK